MTDKKSKSNLGTLLDQLEKELPLMTFAIMYPFAFRIIEHQFSNGIPYSPACVTLACLAEARSNINGTRKGLQRSFRHSLYAIFGTCLGYSPEILYYFCPNLFK